MRIGVMADTHEKHERVEVPDVDLLIHAGDFCGSGRPQEASLFLDWWGDLDVEHKILVAGNHDRCFENRGPKTPGLLKKAREAGSYLRDESVTIDGIEIYGSPYTPEFNNWSFMKKRGDELDEHWSKIPDSTDVLITHGPPYGVLDKAEKRASSPGLWGQGSRTTRYKSVGDRQLGHALKRVQPAYHVFGHIHEQYGSRDYRGVTCVNASLVDRRLNVVEDPYVLTIDPAEL